MNLFNLLNVSGSALLAERQRAEVVASNLANAETTRTPGGGPYQRQEVVFGTLRVTAPSFGEAFDAADNAVRGVQVVKVVTDPTPPVRRYDSSNPDADSQGFVEYPAINAAAESVDMIEASRAYQLNVDAVQATKQMITQALTILNNA